jgi:hypothetical protein
MGTTLGSIHLYNAEESAALEELRDSCLVKNLSEGWTSLFNSEWQDAELMNEEAARFSKLIDAPAAAFYSYDDDLVMLTLYRYGKSLAVCGASRMDGAEVPNMNLPAFVEQFGIDDPGGERLAALLQCEDIDLVIGMLEEYLGVCLLADEEFFEYDEDSEYVRARGREKFDQYIEKSAC